MKVLRSLLASLLHVGAIVFVLQHQKDPPDCLEALTLSSLNALSLLYFFWPVYFSYFVYRICFVLCISLSSAAQKNINWSYLPNIDDKYNVDDEGGDGDEDADDSDDVDVVDDVIGVDDGDEGDDYV